MEQQGSGRGLKRVLAGAAAVAFLASTLVLSGCVVDANTPVATNIALSKVRVAQWVESANDEQVLDEYGLFYSTDQQAVIDVDGAGSADAHGAATIITNPDVKQVRVLTTYHTAVSESGTLTVDAKNLTPGTTYYYRVYSIGRSSDGNKWHTVYKVGSFTVSNPTLKSLSVSRGTKSPSFKKTTYAYTNTISRTTSSSKITVVPTLAGSSVQMRIDAGPSSFVRSKTVSVSRGHSKVLYILVTAPDGITAQYTVTVTRKN